MKTLPTSGRFATSPPARMAAGLVLFAGAYAILNYHQLVHDVLYRMAAHDYPSAITAYVSLSAQALALLLGVTCLPRTAVRVLFVLIGASAYANIVFGDILGDTIDVQKMAWMFAETHQAGQAFGLFIVPALLGAAKLICALALLGLTRRLVRPLIAQRQELRWAGHWLLVCAVLIVPSFVALRPAAAERNVFGYTAALMTAPPPPARAPVSARPGRPAVDKIVWLIDESVAYASYARVLQPGLARFAPVDFGKAASVANCSAPSNVALRAGIPVRTASAATDLRTMPTIWAYARKAGFRTMLVDGQVSGPPQNLMLPTEQVLIDAYEARSADLRTDYRIAAFLNARLRAPGRAFIYVVLRGVHFQYRDHYPKGLIPENSPLLRQYETAIGWSKKDVFATLLAGVDRDRVAIVYTSDHGQNVQTALPPHCSADPVQAEFAVPLVAFLPERMRHAYAAAPRTGHSASQIFPTTLAWMGYDPGEVQSRYDRDLRFTTARHVWFGRNVIPMAEGDRVEITASRGFPGR